MTDPIWTGHRGWITQQMQLDKFVAKFFTYEEINGWLQAWCLHKPKNTFIGITTSEIAWFETNIDILIPSTRQILSAAFEEAKKGPWGYPTKDQHMVELFTTGTVRMTYERKIERARNTGVKLQEESNGRQFRCNA